MHSGPPPTLRETQHDKHPPCVCVCVCVSELPVIADEGPLTEIKAVPEAAPQRPAADIPGKTTGKEGDPSTRSATKEEAAHFDPMQV